MLMRFKLALRNNFRNLRRTLINLIMIACGVAGVILYTGFSEHILMDLQRIAVRTQYGHIQVASPLFWERDPNQGPKAALIPDHIDLLKRMGAVPHVQYASGRLSFFGLVSTGEQTVSAQAWSLDPGIESEVVKAMRIDAGKPLANNSELKLLLGSGLQKQLKAKVGDNLTVVGYTYDGAVNAMDLEVAGVFSTGMSEIDNITFLIPLKAAQALLDTDTVENIVVLLDMDTALGGARAAIDDILRGAAKPLLTRPWYDLADLYRQVVAYYKVQNRVFEFIILSLVLLGIMNTVSNSIYERTGEIGTLRALGDREIDIIVQFVLEAATLAALGILIGFGLGAVLAHIVTASDIPIVLPGASVPLTIRIDLMPQAFVQAACLAFSTTVVAAFFPSLHAARLNIVEALKRNI